VRETEIEFGGSHGGFVGLNLRSREFDGGPRRIDAGFGSFESRAGGQISLHSVIVLLSGRHAGFNKLRVAVGIEQRLRLIGLGLRELCLGL
jgi:hypothetical protein